MPPSPLHISTYVAVEVGLTEVEPERAMAPLHEPEAVQSVVLRDVHERSEESPTGIAPGVAVRVSDGVGYTFTVTDAVEVAVPFPQASVYVVVAEGFTTVFPDVVFEPVHPFDASHAVALVEFHVRSDVPPGATCVGSASMVTVG
jgi:hypothetical protein